MSVIPLNIKEVYEELKKEIIWHILELIQNSRNSGSAVLSFYNYFSLNL